MEAAYSLRAAVVSAVIMSASLIAVFIAIFGALVATAAATSAAAAVAGLTSFNFSVRVTSSGAFSLTNASAFLARPSAYLSNKSAPGNSLLKPILSRWL